MSAWVFFKGSSGCAHISPECLRWPRLVIPILETHPKSEAHFETRTIQRRICVVCSQPCTTRYDASAFVLSNRAPAFFHYCARDVWMIRMVETLLITYLYQVSKLVTGRWSRAFSWAHPVRDGHISAFLGRSRVFEWLKEKVKLKFC